MAKRKLNPWETPERDSLIDTMFTSMQDAVFEETGLKVSLATEMESQLVGLPLPSLSLRYMLQSTMFPLGRIVQITGEEGSCKSAFLNEIIRWHMLYGGGAVVAENEDKDSPDMRNGMLEWNPAWLRRLDISQTHMLEEWQAFWTKSIANIRAQQDRKDGPGRTVPVCFAVDSLMSTAPREELENIEKAGFAVRAHALAANLIAKYMRTMPYKLEGYPFTVVGTNHLKPKIDFQGRPGADIPGGKAVKFHETYEVEMKRIKDINTLNYGGLEVRMICKKNSLGPSRKEIIAQLLWWAAPNETDGIWRNWFMWDWHTSSINLLLSFDNERGEKTIYKRLQEICDIKVVSKGSDGMCWSRALGILEEQPVVFRTAGAMLEQHPEILDELYKVLGITKRYPFQPGVDYRRLIDEARANIRAAQAVPVEQVEALPEMAPGDQLPLPGTNDMMPETDDDLEDVGAEETDGSTG